MKTPSPRKLAAPLAIAALLAALTMGNITLCDVALLGLPEEADTLRVTVQAGQTAADIASSVFDAYLFRLCPPGVVSGVYPVSHIFGGPPGITIVDLATSSTTPPGHYFVNYTETYENFPFPSLVLTLGVIDLTITPGPEPELLHSCFYAQAEIIQVGVPVTFNATCSTGPIAQYKWWFDYNNNPSSSPSITTTAATAQTTYGSIGQRTVRLVVHAAGGEEAEITHTYVVSPPYAVQVAP